MDKIFAERMKKVREVLLEQGNTCRDGREQTLFISMCLREMEHMALTRFTEEQMAEYYYHMGDMMVCDSKGNGISNIVPPWNPKELT